jgi:hypothetical protein
MSNESVRRFYNSLIRNNNGRITPQEKASWLVYAYLIDSERLSMDPAFSVDEIHIRAWQFFEVHQNWAAILTTPLLKSMIYRVTYDGDLDKLFLASYDNIDAIEFFPNE